MKFVTQFNSHFLFFFPSGHQRNCTG